MLERVVNHRKYGQGVVQGFRYKGFELQVAFDDGLTRWVRRDELVLPLLPFGVGDWVVHKTFGEGRVTAVVPWEDTFKVSVLFEDVGSKDLIQSIAQLEKVSQRKEVCSVIESPKFRKRRMIEAFRLGIVPYDCVEEFTFGRDEETRTLMEWLNNSYQSTLFVVGEYGTGKTHLLHYVYGRALQEGFAVAYVEMDPNETPFHKPKRVYSRIVQNLRYRATQDGQLRGFRDFLKEALALDAFKKHEYFKHLIGRTSDETLWDWIEARESIVRPWSFYNWSYSALPGLYDYSTAANIYCYLLSALGWAAKEVLGLKGFLLIFDEAEEVDRYYYSVLFQICVF